MKLTKCTFEDETVLFYMPDMHSKVWDNEYFHGAYGKPISKEDVECTPHEGMIMYNESDDNDGEATDAVTDDEVVPTPKRKQSLHDPLAPAVKRKKRPRFDAHIRDVWDQPAALQVLRHHLLPKLTRDERWLINERILHICNDDEVIDLTNDSDSE